MKAIKIISVLVVLLIMGFIFSCSADGVNEDIETVNISVEREKELVENGDFFYKKLEISENGEFKIFEETALRESLEKDLKEKGLNVTLTDFVIKEASNRKNDNTPNLLLIATSEDGLTKIAMRMKVRTDIPPFETSTFVFALFGERVICTGACDVGCQPYIIGEKPDGSVLEDDEYFVDDIGCSFCIPPLGSLPSCERIVLPREKF